MGTVTVRSDPSSQEDKAKEYIRISPVVLTYETPFLGMGLSMKDMHSTSNEEGRRESREGRKQIY